MNCILKKISEKFQYLSWWMIFAFDFKAADVSVRNLFSNDGLSPYIENYTDI